MPIDLVFFRRFVLSGLLVFVSIACVWGESGPQIREVEPRIWSCDFVSASLNRPMRFMVIIPADATRESKPIPTIYLLHGRGRNENSLLASANGREQLLASHCVIVLPRGDDGWYINSPKLTKDRYADYLDEVMKIAESNFPVARDSSHRAIAGWSMGGFGAAYTAEREPDKFAALATIIGLLDFPREPIAETGQNYEVPIDRFGSDQEVWKSFNPRLQAGKLGHLSVMIVIGERGFDRQMNEAFIQALAEAGNSPEILRLPGGHSFDTVGAAISPILAFLEKRIY